MYLTFTCFQVQLFWEIIHIPSRARCQTSSPVIFNKRKNFFLILKWNLHTAGIAAKVRAAYASRNVYTDAVWTAAHNFPFDTWRNYALPVSRNNYSRATIRDDEPSILPPSLPPAHHGMRNNSRSWRDDKAYFACISANTMRAPVQTANFLRAAYLCFRAPWTKFLRIFGEYSALNLVR